MLHSVSHLNQSTVLLYVECLLSVEDAWWQLNRDGFFLRHLSFLRVESVQVRAFFVEVEEGLCSLQENVGCSLDQSLRVELRVLGQTRDYGGLFLEQVG